MADNNDIFSHLNNEDRTILKPSPGGGGNKTVIRPMPGTQMPAGGMQNQAPPPAARPVNLHNVLDKSDNNPVIAVAKPLLSLLTRLSQTHQHQDVNGLHARTIQEIRNFEINAQQKGISSQQITIARYILCSAIDETVLNTPWGSNSSWPSQSMLSTFHRENTGGQKFFAILEKMQQNPAPNIDLLELIAVCLALGFQGKYRVVQGGLNHIETIRTQLHHQIALLRGEYERSLSLHCEGIKLKSAVDKNIPLWVIAAITGAIIIAAYIGFSVALKNDAAPVLQKLQEINQIEQTTES